MKPSILIVGAGAVGQVYARFLMQAGAQVTFFVKEKYRAELEGGLPLYHFRLRGYRRELLEGYRLISDPEQVAAEPWDQVWLTMASDALRSDLTQQVLAHSGDATVVSIQLDLEDSDFLREQVGHDRLVQGIVNFLSYQSPLPGYHSPPAGIAWHLFPIPGDFAGPWQRLSGVVNLMDLGGFPIRAVESFERAAAPKAALNIPLVAALETAGWQLDRCMNGPALELGLKAAREALAVVAKLYDAEGEVLPLKLLAKPFVVRNAVRALDKMTPYDLEAYLKYHFTKVGVQTRIMLHTYRQKAQQLGLPSAALADLLRALGEPV